MASSVKAGPVDSAADLTFFIGTSGGVTINGGNAVTGGANVTSTDITASNGVIHVIDRVILPPDIPTAAVYGGLTELVKAVGAAADIPAGTSVLKALQGAGPFTVFAPTDDAFKAITAPSDTAVLRDVLLYHVVGSSVDLERDPGQGRLAAQEHLGQRRDAALQHLRRREGQQRQRASRRHQDAPTASCT